MCDHRHLSVQITWANGATIGGSSGSPLINVATQRIVGVLTGGYSNCQFQTRSDYYGRLSAVLSPVCSAKLLVLMLFPMLHSIVVGSLLGA